MEVGVLKVDSKQYV